MAQPHGGALRHGSLPGNTPGTGRPKDEVRGQLLYLATGKGIPFLETLLDGKIPVRLIGKCEKCDHESDREYSHGELEKLLDEIKSSVDHRLNAVEKAFRYGVGTKDEIDIRAHPEVQRFVNVHAQATREIAGDDMYRRIAQRVQELAA